MKFKISISERKALDLEKIAYEFVLSTLQNLTTVNPFFIGSKKLPFNMIRKVEMWTRNQPSKFIHIS